MKNFLTSMMGALVALVVFTFCGFLLVVGIAGAIVSMGVRNARPSAKVENGSYLVFDLSANITDAPPLFDFGDFPDTREGTLQLRALTRALGAAAKDGRIAGILIKGSLRPADFGSGYGALAEVRAALERFRRVSGKPVRAHLEFATTRDYYLASVADTITMDPYGLIHMPGLWTEPMFYAGAFEKYGIGIQVTRVGKYKSFVEPFIRRDMSPENREETQRLLDTVWGGLVSEIARSRGLKAPQLQAIVDAEGFIRPEAAVKGRLADRAAYWDQVIGELREATGRKGSKEGFKQVSLPAYIRQLQADSARASGRAIGLVYAEGDIVDGEGRAGEVGGSSFARELRKLREDDDIKAIVLRVNSPGGSATAAEEIQREVRLARKVKPVIVSMGSYAASGGYWISAYGNRIFAEPETITGSIGVFGIHFDVRKLANDFGITFDGVKTGRFADSLTITRPKTGEEIAVFQGMVDWIYGQFVGKVAEGRGMTPGAVEKIAQGRVWSGSEALKLGLVDEIGGLGDAIRCAAVQAKLAGGYRVVEYPRKKGLAEALAEMFGRMAPETVRSRPSGLVGTVRSTLESQLSGLEAYNDPREVYARLPLEISIR